MKDFQDHKFTKLPNHWEPSGLKAALAYARRGWPVFPCAGKHPLTAHGFKDATIDPVQIRQWWKQWLDANISIPTGTTSELVVLDVDPQHGGDDSLAALEKAHGPLPQTVTSRTGGGGRHHCFQHPEEPIRNSAGKLGPGLDIRGDGGYIVAPPSLHASGRRYAWLNHPDQTGLAPLPAWLLALVQASATPLPSLSASQECFVEGERNERLFRLACSLRHYGLTSAVLATVLWTINQMQCSPPLSAVEMRHIVTSALRYDAGHDRNDLRVWRYRTVEATEVMPWRG